MRIGNPVDYATLEQAMLKGICPLCTYLKNFQSASLKKLSPETVNGLCNFHAWALAAAVDKITVARIFRRLLRDASSVSERTDCTVCSLIRGQENETIQGFIQKLSQRSTREWMSLHGAICLYHGARLLASVDTELQSSILEVLERTATELKEELVRLQQGADTSGGSGAGALGHAAEFLVSQRGLHI